MATATQTAEYELVLMLDPEAPDELRDKIAADARQRIEAAGELKDDRAWGMRKLAYEIRQRTEADYRFFRFQTESSLLDQLDHNLKITDGVLRFRIFKVDPRLPVIEPPPPISLASSGPRGGSGRRGGPGGRPPRPAPDASEGSRPAPDAREGAGEAPAPQDEAPVQPPEAPEAPVQPPSAEPDDEPEGEPPAEEGAAEGDQAPPEDDQPPADGDGQRAE